MDSGNRLATIPGIEAKVNPNREITRRTKAKIIIVVEPHFPHADDHEPFH